MKPKKRPAETPEKIIARLEKDLPDGYLIVNMADAIDFSSLIDTEPKEPKPKQPPPPPPQRLQVVFEEERLFHEKPLTKTRSDPTLPDMVPLLSPMTSPEQVAEVARRTSNDWRMLTNWAVYSDDPRVKALAGRAVANRVSQILNAWPEKKTLKTCVSETIKRIRRENEGWKQRWERELRLRGAPKKRTKKSHLQLQRFVSKCEFRLRLLVPEVIDIAFAKLGKYSSSPVVACKHQAKVLLEWIISLQGAAALFKKVRNNQLETWDAAQRIEEIVEKAKHANVEDYFLKVFRPALEDGPWRTWKELPEDGFGEFKSVMLTMLKMEIFEQAE